MPQENPNIKFNGPGESTALQHGHLLPCTARPTTSLLTMGTSSCERIRVGFLRLRAADFSVTAPRTCILKNWLKTCNQPCFKSFSESSSILLPLQGLIIKNRHVRNQLHSHANPTAETTCSILITTNKKNSPDGGGSNHPTPSSEK